MSTIPFLIFVKRNYSMLKFAFLCNVTEDKTPPREEMYACPGCDISTFLVAPRAANYCQTSDNVRLNLANVRAKVILIGHWSDFKVILIGHWSDHKKKLSHYTLICCDKIRLQIHSICILQ
jgi:hypothetical protein